MKTFKIGSDGDLVIENGNLIMIDGKDELRQSIERILTTNKNEWFLNIEFGLDYKAIQGKGKSKKSIKLTITEAIHQDSRVIEVDIKNITISHDRKLEVYGTATSTNGDVIDLSSLQEVIEIG